ncbi:MAG: DUF1926 domain-containing protein [bacterium]|jgi:alpha-amylase
MSESFVNLIFVVHNHQPVGNFDHVFAQAADEAYLPFLRMLRDYPDIKVGLHTSGCLWDWLASSRQEYVELASELHHQGRLEFLGGGYYEPILTAIPPRDLRAQFARMDGFLTRNFGVVPEGFWCTERVWSPALPYFLAGTGKKYTLLDDNHFICAGKSQGDLLRPLKTTYLGQEISLFPISEKMRYLIPFREVNEIEDYLRSQSSPDPWRVVVFGDDGEKFGVWPGTADWVWKRGWMRRFLEMLSANAGWIKTALPGEFLHEHPPVDTVHIPSTSYREMTGWALPAPAARDFERAWNEIKDNPEREVERRFLRGGHFDNFFSKYEESDRMEREMLYVSALLDALQPKLQPRIAEEAERLLHEGQCNCAYWHGVFGGLYLNYLRHAVYRNLVSSKRLLLEHAAKPQTIEFNGFARLRAGDIAAEICTRTGCIESVDFLPGATRVTDVLTRRYESYHEGVSHGKFTNDYDHESIHGDVRVKEAGLSEYLAYDLRPRRCFDVFVFKPGVSAESLVSSSCETLEAEPQRPFRCEIISKSAFAASLRGAMALIDDLGSLEIEKKIELSETDNAVEAGLTIRFGALKSEFDAEICVLWNFGLLAGDSPDRYYELDGKRLKLSSFGELHGGSKLSMVDEWQGLRITVYCAKAGADFIYYPVETVSASEGGLERTYQGSAIMLLRREKLSPTRPDLKWKHSVTIKPL